MLSRGHGRLHECDGAEVSVRRKELVGRARRLLKLFVAQDGPRIQRGHWWTPVRRQMRRDRSGFCDPRAAFGRRPRTVQAVAGLVERHGADQRCALWDDARRLPTERAIAHARTRGGQRLGSDLKRQSIAPRTLVRFSFPSLVSRAISLDCASDFWIRAARPEAQRLKRVSGQGAKPQNLPSPLPLSFSLNLLLLPGPSPWTGFCRAYRLVAVPVFGARGQVHNRGQCDPL